MSANDSAPIAQGMVLSPGQQQPQQLERPIVQGVVVQGVVTSQPSVPTVSAMHPSDLEAGMSITVYLKTLVRASAAVRMVVTGQT